jgi:hypothetical protein
MPNRKAKQPTVRVDIRTIQAARVERANTMRQIAQLLGQASAANRDGGTAIVEERILSALKLLPGMV